MFKVKINCDKLQYNGRKITKNNADEIIKLLKKQSYNYITSGTLLYKKFKRRDRVYIQKSLELYTNQSITRKQLLRMISKLHHIGITCSDDNHSKIDFIDTSNYSVLHRYDFSNNPLITEKRNSCYKNGSSYSTHVLFKRS